MNLSSKVFSDGAFSAFRVLLSTTRGIIIIPLITKLLGAGSYGIWAAVLGFVSLVSSTAGMHLHGSLIRYTSQESDNEQTYSDVLFLTVTIGAVVCTGVLFFGLRFDLGFLFDGEVTQQSMLVLSTSLLILASLVLNINLNFPRSKGVVKIYDLGIVGKDALQTATLVAVFFLGGSIVTGIFALAVISVILNILIFIYIFRSYSIPWPQTGNFEQYVRYGGPMVPEELSSSLMTNGDKYLILILLSPKAVGIYATARGISAGLTRFSSVLNPTLYPSVSSAWEQGNVGEIAKLYTQIFRYYAILAIPAFFGLALLSSQLLTVIATKDIAAQGAVLIPILAFGFLLRGFDDSLNYILTATEDTAKLTKAVIISVSLNLVLNSISIFLYGIIGAAIATTVSQLLMFYFIYRYSTSKIDFTLPLKTFIRSTIAALAMVGVLYVFNPGSTPISQTVLYPIIGVILYFVILTAEGEFNSSELQSVRDLIDNRH